MIRKDAVITVRVPRPTRRRLETLARREGRSLSQQVERLIERGLDGADGAVAAADGTARLSGLLASEPAPEYGDFRSVRTLLSGSLRREGRRSAASRR
jgi:predicted DNA-binding protein